MGWRCVASVRLPCPSNLAVQARGICHACASQCAQLSSECVRLTVCTAVIRMRAPYSVYSYHPNACALQCVQLSSECVRLTVCTAVIQMRAPYSVYSCHPNACALQCVQLSSKCVRLIVCTAAIHACTSPCNRATFEALTKEQEAGMLRLARRSDVAGQKQLHVPPPPPLSDIYSATADRGLHLPNAWQGQSAPCRLQLAPTTCHASMEGVPQPRKPAPPMLPSLPPILPFPPLHPFPHAQSKRGLKTGSAH